MLATPYAPTRSPIDPPLHRPNIHIHIRPFSPARTRPASPASANSSAKRKLDPTSGQPRSPSPKKTEEVPPVCRHIKRHRVSRSDPVRLSISTKALLASQPPPTAALVLQRTKRPAMSFVPYADGVTASPWPPVSPDASDSASHTSSSMSGNAPGGKPPAPLYDYAGLPPPGRPAGIATVNGLPAYSPPDLSSGSNTASGLPPVLSLKRPNPKRLSLSLSVPPSASSSPASSSGGSTATEDPFTPSAPTPFGSTSTGTQSVFSAPFSPGPPKTPHLAISVPDPQGRSTVPRAAAKAGLRRPSLLSLITQPPTSGNVPPTPGGVAPPAMQPRQRSQLRASTQVDELAVPAEVHAFGSRSRSAYPSFSTIFEPPKSATSTYMPLDSLASALPSAGGLDSASASASGSATASGSASPAPRYLSSSPSLSPSVSLSGSPSASLLTTPASSPPLEPSYVDSGASRPAEPYSDGPIEILPGFFLGAEDSYLHPGWQGPSRTVRILNVAQEIDNPFLPATEAVEPGWGGSGPRVRQKVLLSSHEVAGRSLEYCHLRWSHGETGLADLPLSATLDELVRGSSAGPEPKGKGRDEWGFWEAIEWMDEGRRSGIPILVHCQCGVSRSATLAIAYVMALAAAGTYPRLLGGLSTMQQAYEYVKKRSSWIGPNVSLVFQLVEFARNVSTLLSGSPAYALGQIRTAWPAAGRQETEDEWARRRRAFDEAQGGADDGAAQGGEGEEVGMSPAEEAREWDRAMVKRHQAKVHA